MISESVVADLDVEPLVAVLAHEAAHIRLQHLRRKLVYGTLGSIVVIGVSIAIQLLISPALPRSLHFIGILPVILLGNLAGQLYSARVSRRHEAEADAAAVNVAGVEALCRALDVLGGPSERWVHRRWTTHGTQEERLARIRSLEQQSE